MRQVILVEAGIRWRPHVKAIRVPALVRMLLEAGATGVVCATLGEAEALAAAGLRDSMIANQLVGAPKVARLMSLARRAELIVAVDSAAHLRALDAAAQAAGVVPRVVIEVDTGMGRTGVGVAHECALTIATTVISRPTPTRIVCDAGWKRMAQHPAPPEPLDVGDVRSLALSAEHATIELAAPRSLPVVGDPVEFVAGYSDATVFLHDTLYGARAGRVEATWPIPGRARLP